MPNEILISDIVDLNKDQRDIDALLAMINKVDVAIQEVNKNPINLGNIGGLKELRAATEQLLKATQQLNKAITDSVRVTKAASDADLKAAKVKTEEARQSTEAARAKKEEAKAAIDNAKAKQIETKERDNAAKSAASEKKMIEDIGNDYKQLSLAYNDAALKAKNLALQLGINHPKAQEALSDARSLKNVLDSVDQATGNYTRNVGNYGGALNNLRLQTSQLLRETPALAINLQTFILALSNNLPLFFEAIQQVKKGNEDLAASGQKPVSVFSQIIKSLFSLQSILTIGVTLLTVFSSKIISGVKSLFGFEDAEKKAERQTKELTESLKRQGDEMSDFSDSVDKAVNKTIAKLKELGATQEELDNIQNIGLTLKKGKAEVDAQANIDYINKQLEQLKKLKQGAFELQTTQKAFTGDKLTQVVPKGKLGEVFQNNPIASRLADVTLSAADVQNVNKIQGIVNDLKDLQNTKAFEELSKSQQTAFTNLQKVFEAVYTNAKEAKNLTDEIGQNLADQQAENVTAIRNATRQKVEGEIESQQEIRDRNKKALLDAIQYEQNVKAGNFDALRRQVVSQRDFELNAEKDKIGKINAIRNLELANPENTDADKIRINAQADREIARARLTEGEKIKIRKEAASKLFDINEEERKRNLEADKDIFVQQKQLLSEQLTELSKNTEFTTIDRLGFQQSAFNAQKAIIEKEYEVKKESVKNTFLTDAEKLAIEVDYENKLLELTRQSQQAITAVIKSELDKQQGLREEDFNKIQRLYGLINGGDSEQYVSDVIALNKSFQQKEVSHKKYLERRKELDYNFRQETIKNTISEIQTELDLYKGAENSLIAVERNLGSLRQNLSNTTDNGQREQILQQIDIEQKKYDIAKKNVDKKIDLEKKLGDAIKEASDDATNHDVENQRKRIEAISEALGKMSDLINEVTSFSDAISQRRLQNIEMEQGALEERYLREQELIRATYTNQIDQQQKLSEAEARYNARKQQLLKQEKEEKIKQARFDKAAAIANIILKTAQAVMSALAMTPPNVPLAIANGVIGAAQLAVAVATPLPKYYKGKNAEDDYEGYAWVDDGGKPEAIIRENGDVEIGSNKPRVTYLSSKDIVLPDAKMLAWNATRTATSQPVFIQNESGLNKDQYMTGVRRIEKAVRNIKLNIYTRNPLDDWMNGKVGTEDLFR